MLGLLTRLLAAFALLVALVLPAAAAEGIRSFDADIVLSRDGTVDVTERITVEAEGFSITRGIFRDIPTTLTNPNGSLLRANLDVLSVTRDGRAENYALEDLDNHFKRIRIGNPDVYLDRGLHTYEVRYTMTRMGRTFEDHDELYWNVTGNYWSFPIASATARVTLPAEAVISKLVGYTGPVGSNERAVTVTRTSDNTATFKANRRLDAGEGMSVALAFQKGVLEAPGGLTGIGYWLSDHRDTILPLIAVLLVLGYNFFAWDLVGRDPPKGTIIPLFHPPKGYSPALAHYISEMGWKRDGWTAFTASIFDLGVKGLVKIDQTTKKLRITLTGAEPAETLPPGEAMLFGYLKSKGDITVDTTTGPELNQKRSEFISTLQNENRQVYFRNNTGYVFLGGLLAVLLLGAMVFFEVLDPLWLIIAVVVGIGIGLFTSIFSNFWNGGGFSRFVIVIWIGIAAFNLIGAGTDVISGFQVDTAVFAAASIVLITIVFAILLRAPTVQGRKVMDDLDGFKMYINTAEKERLNMVNEPPMTIERFESILPFAIALGIEKPWSQYFQSELARNAVAGATVASYSPGWYSGRDFSSGNFSNTVSSVASSMTSAMVAAQPQSSSSSAFSGGGGGGGGSGGGGGGGGGGGW
ncbi:DUF2207 domain-containing protein [Paradevosia shaoguanensis]|uniref:DUF2207 domain-containing protein n=1 Tax=Paradevosia shaoguanensis TaxID=1335043 RepID=UPI0019327AB7|nr:DUF2207 domain-containing protein [Paradevosia shaoguanensis]